MSYQQQSTRERFTIEQKYLICDYKEKSPSLNQEQLGVWAQKEFKLSHPAKQRTISNLLSSKDKIYKSFASGNANAKSTKATKVPQLDDDVLKYIQDMNAKSIPINRAAVATYAKIVAIRKYEMHKLPKKNQMNFSDGWLTKLFKRIGVKSRHLYGENSSVDLTA